MSPKLKQEIEDYLNSFGDEELSFDEMCKLFYDANSLLGRVLKEHEKLSKQVKEWRHCYDLKGEDERLFYNDGDLVDKAADLFIRNFPQAWKEGGNV